MTKRCSDVIAEVHATLTLEVGQIRAAQGRSMNLLDIGCWDGAATARYSAILGGSARGVEIFPEQARSARDRGIDVATVDLETEPLPWPSEIVDVAIANQVFEHLKNVWLAMSEIARLIVPGGFLIFSVPNLASLHNRLMLGIGLQPSCIRTFGPHIRGFTYRQVREFIEYEGFFDIRRAKGVGFYPLPAVWARPFAKSWVGGSHTPIFVAQRTAPAGGQPPWRRMMSGFEIGEQTYYKELGDQKLSAPQAADSATTNRH